MAPQKGKGGEKDKAKEKEKERKTTCVGCRKAFNKSEYCVICGSCNYWYHKTCSGMAEEVFKCVDNYYKENGSTFWSCQPCATYSKGITARIREMDKRLEGVEKHQDEQDSRMEKMEMQVERLSREVQSSEDKAEEAVGRKEKNLYEELRERELRKKNVVFHGVGELQAEKSTWEERVEWDKKSCLNIFSALALDMGVEAIRFTRRLGEKGKDPRPLLTGFHTETERAKLLKNAKKLESTVFKDVNVVPDLTKRQREEEAELKKEADKKNKNLSESDKAKNLQWAVVGARGERRLTKVQIQQEGVGGNRRGGWREDRERGPLTGANRVGGNIRGPPKRMTEQGDSQKSSQKKTSEPGTSKQANQKETTDSETEDMDTQGEEEEEQRDSETGEDSEEEQEKGEPRKATKRKERSGEGVEGAPPEKR